MLGVTVNALAVIVGAVIGLLCKKGIPERLTNAIMTGIALCVLYIGISGAGGESDQLFTVISPDPENIQLFSVFTQGIPPFRQIERRKIRRVKPFHGAWCRHRYLAGY